MGESREATICTVCWAGLAFGRAKGWNYFFLRMRNFLPCLFAHPGFSALVFLWVTFIVGLIGTSAT